MKAFISWSGGKEASLSCYKTIQDKDFEAACLLNMAGEDGKRSRSHGISSEVLKRQAKSMEIPLIQRKSTWSTYEGEFKKAVAELKKEGVAAGVFGDMYIDRFSSQEHKNWVERVCTETGITPVLPLWNMKGETLLEEFISLGFKAIVIALNTEFLDETFLGRVIDREFIEELKSRENIDICGETGEYHTFVYDGPVFKKPVDFEVRGTEARDKQRLLVLE